MKNFTTLPSIKLFAVGLTTKIIYPELKKILLQKTLKLKKGAEFREGDLTCHVFSLEDVVANFATSNPIKILTIEK